MLNKTTGINESKTLTIQTKSGITINADATAKNITHVKKIIFRILLHIIVKNVNVNI